MTRIGRYAAALAISASAAVGVAAKAETVLVYIGSYSDAKDPGVQVFKLDMASGALTKVGGASGTSNPSFLAIHPGKKFIYAACEAGKVGSVAAFSLDDQGIPTLMNTQPSEGSGPCFVAVDKAGKNVLTANYGSGSVACIPIGEDGKLAPPSSSVQHKGSSTVKGRQEGPHAHSINLDAANKFAFACDLGLDKVLVYKFDSATGKLTPNDPPATDVPPGSGPRHFAFHPGGKYAYACGEMAMTVIAFTYDADKGVLKEQQVLGTLPEGAERKGTSTAETQVAPDGKHVYVSNRGHNTIAVFSVDEATGKLKAAGHFPSGGKTPRNFGIDPSGQFLIAAHQDSNNVVVFKLDAKTGLATPAGHEVQVPKPVCVKFLVK